MQAKLITIKKTGEDALLFVDFHGLLGLPPQGLETPASLPRPRRGHAAHFDFIKGNTGMMRLEENTVFIKKDFCIFCVMLG